MWIAQAVPDDANRLAPLFNAYRSYFGGDSNVVRSEAFLTARLMSLESIVFYAYDETAEKQDVLGFAQLYPSFSSVTLESLWILNDLYVAESTRGQGVGQGLLTHVLQFAEGESAKGVILETTPKNTGAQALYTRNGFRRDDAVHFTHHFAEQAGKRN